MPYSALAFEMELCALAYDDQPPGTLPNPDCPRCDGEGAYRDGDGAREWMEECPCLYGPAPEKEEIPL